MLVRDLRFRFVQPLVKVLTSRGILDHVGVSNAQLIKEGVPIAAQYNQRSVAEQNSLDLSWDLLMEDRYSDLGTTCSLHEKTSFDSDNLS